MTVRTGYYVWRVVQQGKDPRCAENRATIPRAQSDGGLYVIILRQSATPGLLDRTLAMLVLSITLSVAGNTHAADGQAPAQPLSAWSTATASPVDEAQLYRDLAAADYLLIGEIHDNPHHHRLQAELLAHFADSHPGGVSVGFEQLNRDQQASLDTFLEQNPADAAALAEAVTWHASGWPDFAIYQPLFSAALQRELPIVPLMFATATTREVMRHGVEAALPAAAMARLRPDTLLSAGERQQVEREMQDAHCGKLPASMLPAMVDVQIARDAYMALSMTQAADRAVIITGNGHARRDRGIPAFLQRLRPEAHVVVVTLLEQSETQTAEAQMREQARPDIADFTLMTPAHPRDDPCLAFQ